MSVRWRQAAALLALLLGLVAACPISRAQADPSGFTPSQRAAIVEVMRAALKADPSILRDAIAALQTDEARAQEATSRQAIGRLGPSIARAPGDPVVGNPDGDVTLVEFYDVRCPYCRSMLPVVAGLLAADPKLRLVYKDIPILGPGSVLGARAVLAAQAQGGYARLRDAVMRGPSTVTEDTLHTQAAASGTRLGPAARGYGQPGDPGAHRREPRAGARPRHPGHPGLPGRHEAAAGSGGIARAAGRGGGGAGDQRVRPW